MSELGYRVAEVSPYEISGERFAAVLWIRDGAVSRFEVDADAEQVRSLNQSNLVDGFLPATLSGYRTQQDLVLYACVWIRPPQGSGVIEADLYVDVHEDDHESQGWMPMSERGLSLPRSNVLVRRNDGTEAFSSIRWKTESVNDYRDQWKLLRNQFFEQRDFNRALSLVYSDDAVPSFESSSVGVTAVWWHGLPVESSSLDFQPRREHLRFAKAKLDAGFYPVSLRVSAKGADPTSLVGSTWWRGLDRWEDKVLVGKRKRNLLIAMFQLGETQPLQQAIADSTQPEVRGGLISGFHQFDLQPKWLADQFFDLAAEPPLRRSSGMALSVYPRDSVFGSDRCRGGTEIARTVRGTMRTRGFVPFANRFQSVGTWSWNGRRVIRFKTARSVPSRVTGWSSSSRKNPVWLGSLPDEPGRDENKESPNAVILPHSFAIATREVTLEQYQAFRPDHRCSTNYVKTPDSPVVEVSWFDAAAYCRWLSEQEGVPGSQMCYPELEEIRPGVRIETDYRERIGYRLPTEAEWELAARGSVDSLRWFGMEPDRLDQHDWTKQNSGYIVHPGGSLLPNDLGLFDMLGNAMETCDDRYEPAPRFRVHPRKDQGLAGVVVENEMAIAERGGAFIYQPLDARASQRHRHGANSKHIYIGFRIARTVVASEN